MNKDHDIVSISRSPEPISGPAGQSLAAVYRRVINARNWCYDRISNFSKEAGRTVISIGGIRAGGTGKTPVAQLVGSLVLQKDFSVAFLSRGYGRKSKECCIVHPQQTTDWEIAGDEPAMLHENLPDTWLGICSDRLRSASILSKLVPPKTVFILDDGFQHRKIRRNLDIVCLNDSVFEDHLIPRGYLREPVDSLRRAHIALIIGEESAKDNLEKIRETLLKRYPHLSVFSLVQKPGKWVNVYSSEIRTTPPHRTPAAICGIARPHRFLSMLKQLDVEPSKTIIFPDHHIYNSNQLKRIRELYSHGGVTTQKDAVRIRKLGIVICPDLWYLKIELKFVLDDSLNRFNKLLDHYLHTHNEKEEL